MFPYLVGEIENTSVDGKHSLTKREKYRKCRDGLESSFRQHKLFTTYFLVWQSPVSHLCSIGRQTNRTFVPLSCGKYVVLLKRLVVWLKVSHTGDFKVFHDSWLTPLKLLEEEGSKWVSHTWERSIRRPESQKVETYFNNCYIQTNRSDESLYQDQKGPFLLRVCRGKHQGTIVKIRSTVLEVITGFYRDNLFQLKTKRRQMKRKGSERKSLKQFKVGC